MSASRERTKTPGIYKRGGRYVFRYRGPSGAPRWSSAATIAEAKTKRAALTTDVDRGEYRAASRVTFADYAERWAESYVGRTSRGVNADTIADYRRNLDRHAIPFFGRTPLTAIGPPELRAFAAHVAARGVKRGTVRLALAPVKALLATAHEDGLIRANPAAGLRNLIPADEGQEAEQVRALSADELRALLDALPERWRPFFIFLAETGLRFGEAQEARFGDLDLGAKTLRVERRFYRGRVAPPKGRKTRRVPLSGELAQSFWPPREPEELLFTSEKGQRLDHSNLLSRVLKPAARAAGLGEIGFHVFRHTRATLLFRAGWNAAQVQRFLGHTDPGFTLRTYVHLLDTDLPEPEALGGGTRVVQREGETGRDGEAAKEAKRAG